MNPYDMLHSNDEPMSDDDAIRKMANIGAIMENGGDSFSEDDMRLLRDAYSSAPSADDFFESFMSKYLDEDEEEPEEEEDDDEIGLNQLDW